MTFVLSSVYLPVSMLDSDSVRLLKAFLKISPQ